MERNVHVANVCIILHLGASVSTDLWRKVSASIIIIIVIICVYHSVSDEQTGLP